MSKFMSHRKMKAATAVVGNLEARLRVQETITKLLLDSANLALGVRRDADGTIVPELIQKPTAALKEPEMSMRVIEDELSTEDARD